MADADFYEYEFFYGQPVRLVQNIYLKGQVIDEKGWGQYYLLRMQNDFSERWFSATEIMPDPEFMPPNDRREEPDDGGPDDGEELTDFTGSNVIPFEKRKVAGRAAA